MLSFDSVSRKDLRTYFILSAAGLLSSFIGWGGHTPLLCAVTGTWMGAAAATDIILTGRMKVFAKDRPLLAEIILAPPLLAYRILVLEILFIPAAIICPFHLAYCIHGNIKS